MSDSNNLLCHSCCPGGSGSGSNYRLRCIPTAAEAKVAQRDPQKATGAEDRRVVNSDASMRLADRPAAPKQ